MAHGVHAVPLYSGAKIVEAERDLFGRLDPTEATMHVCIRRKQHDAQQQKMQQWFAQPALSGAETTDGPRSLARAAPQQLRKLHSPTVTNNRDCQVISSRILRRGRLSLFQPRASQKNRQDCVEQDSRP